MRTPTQTLIQRAELTDGEREAVGKAIQLYHLNRLSVPEDAESRQGPLILRLDGAETPTALVEDVVGDYRKNITRYQCFKSCLCLKFGKTIILKKINHSRIF